MHRFKRVILLLLDGFGVGELPDAKNYGDEGSNTLGNLAKTSGGVDLPLFEKLGLGCIIPVEGVKPVPKPIASYGKMAERSPGKDSTSGHWEIAGIILSKPFPTYPQGFPHGIIQPFQRSIGRIILGNYPASGTEIIKELGRKHLETGYPIVYTSADSVFQIACHEEIIPVEELYRFCEIAREILSGDHGVARVIARPFIGKIGSFTRTERRKDFSLSPPEETLLDLLKAGGNQVIGIGKVPDLYAHQGLTESHRSVVTQKCLEYTHRAMKDVKEGFIFSNFVEFDTLWGHRNDVEGYARGLEEFDGKLGEILKQVQDDDLLILTADHGNDPTTLSTDHSREYVPLLVYSKKVKEGKDLGIRKTFADLGQTIGENFGVELKNGTSFLKELQ
jgi:phosphopentomutase